MRRTCRRCAVRARRCCPRQSCSWAAQLEQCAFLFDRICRPQPAGGGRRGFKGPRRRQTSFIVESTGGFDKAMKTTERLFLGHKDPEKLVLQKVNACTVAPRDQGGQEASKDSPSQSHAGGDRASSSCDTCPRQAALAKARTLAPGKKKNVFASISSAGRIWSSRSSRAC